ncbi:MAG TPA: glycosyltransferase family 4 protein [Vicinamibacterales bacterium]|nr:glycosyltransferase family 4 protein [Vicinamibacterales bacterium]
MPAPAVCIVAHRAYGSISGGATGHAGGVERQTTMLARWLATRGFRVSLLVWNEGQPPTTTIDGVRVISMCGERDGVPGLRFVHPRWTSLTRALRAADADVYYHNCAEYVTGQIALWCRRHHRRFVYSVASDPECDPRLPMLTERRERMLFRYGLRHADRIVVQTRAQQQRLRDQWHLDSVVLKMPWAGEAPPPADAPSPGARVVWAGRISPEKRLDRLLAIADRLPHITFDIAGGVDETFRAGPQLVEAARRRPNINVLGKVARDRMPGVYQRATCLLCTSDYEGFPNTFLEAWACGIPVVSTVDPDGLVDAEGLGHVGATDDELAQHIQRLHASPAEHESIAERARTYVTRHHLPESALPAFERTFREVMHLGMTPR